MYRKIIYLLLFVVPALTIAAQQPKQVYITLDVSGSMSGNKYVLANYTTQMIVALCDADDDVHMIVYGAEKVLSKEKNPLTVIQRPMNSLSFGSRISNDSQFDDIIGFNRVYHPSTNKQDWLFIIGDGYWGTNGSSYSKDLQKFQETVKGGSLNVCYLQTGENLKEHSDFTEFVEKLGVVDIGKSSTDTKTIQAGCTHFANKILGFSETPLALKKNGQKSIKVVSELPITGFLMVYQDEVRPDKLPKITDALFKASKLSVQHKGTPTTQPIKRNRHEKDLSGNVWRLEAGKTIPANTEIVVNFDKEVNAKNVTIYPLVANIEFNTFGISPAGNPLKQLDSKTYSICQDEKTAKVRIELSEGSKKNLSEELLKKLKVVVKANNKEYAAKYKDGAFECTIDLKDEETQYYAECDCSGYFKRVTPIMTIVKGECEPTEPLVKEMGAVDFGTMSFSQLKDDAIKGIIQDAESRELLDPKKFDIDIEIEDDFMYEKPSLRIEGNTILIDVKPKGDWCECLFPTDLNMKISSTPKSGAFGDKNYVKAVTPVHLKIEKDRPWLSRCFWVIVTLVALLLFIIYLRMLLKKNRFHKYARVKNLYYVEDEPKEIEKNGHPLRRKGLAAWFSRWLNPFGDEKNTVSFIRPRTRAITFTASPSKMRILMAPANFDANTMVIPNYTPKINSKKGQRSIKDEEPIGISSGTSIEIKNVQAGETTRLGHLKFIVQGKDDEGGYRFFIGLLLFLAVIAFIVLLGLLVKSFI